ncbi:hypothetical protein DZF91_35745 [Actinomadura logoneensis]|uniref:Uncharacterized protein n=1 Tax=Actinomadura logoneensis TaxID=2293572 RepID=A0A372JAN3_9ACTN|nr:hypothetical protein DZF91_35745 [Actinomadura logoneensis]
MGVPVLRVMRVLVTIRALAMVGVLVVVRATLLRRPEFSADGGRRTVSARRAATVQAWVTAVAWTRFSCRKPLTTER